MLGQVLVCQTDNAKFSAFITRCCKEGCMYGLNPWYGPVSFPTSAALASPLNASSLKMLPFTFSIYTCMCICVFVCLPGWAKLFNEFTFFNIKQNCLVEVIEQIASTDATCHLPPHLQTRPHKSEAMRRSAPRPHRPCSLLTLRLQTTQLRQNGALGRGQEVLKSLYKQG